MLATTILVYPEPGQDQIRIMHKHDLKVEHDPEVEGGSSFFVPGPNGSIPDDLKVKEVSLRSWIPVSPNRARGIYVLGSAQGEIELNPKGVHFGYSVRISGKTIEGVEELLARIKIGTIKPEVSYEDAQVGSKEREEMKELQSRINGPVGFEPQLRVLRDDLAGGWPFCRTSKLSKRVEKILAGELAG